MGKFVFYSLAMVYNNTNRQVPIMNSRKNTVNQTVSPRIKNREINKARKDVHMSIGCFFLLLSIVALPLFANDKPHRGEFPTCQAACLAAHTAKMEKLMDAYRRESDRVSFQDGIDNVLFEYRVCIDNCRDPMPVK
ncbi:MAG: hypothetical protein A4E62_02204 [Syntrophorhabdus sp. PtaU1.Bin002]|nr:MAG: hypothetical protein A4E58_02258 [Syntrophorhabdus sp. PtaB.Bin006]OPY67726.1 MAG: hypothetical protein A4E62_02204 [Syntrophorhabdus sp. PtaU1.Bin002]